MKKTMVILAVLTAAVLVSSCATGQRKLKYVELHSRECNICARMIPVIEAVQIKYGGRIDVESYGGSSDTGADLVEKYNIKKYPANLFIDAEDKIFFRYEGLLDQKSVEEIIEKKLKAYAVTETAK